MQGGENQRVSSVHKTRELQACHFGEDQPPILRTTVPGISCDGRLTQGAISAQNPLSKDVLREVWKLSLSLFNIGPLSIVKSNARVTKVNINDRIQV